MDILKAGTFYGVILIGCLGLWALPYPWDMIATAFLLGWVIGGQFGMWIEQAGNRTGCRETR